MNDEMYLRCQIEEENTANRLVISKLCDGTSFEARVPFWDVVPVEGSIIREAWLKVEILGKDDKNQRAMVKLPAPALSLGHNVSVSIRDLSDLADIEKNENSGNPQI